TTDDITSASISISTIKTKSITDFIGNLNLNQNIKNVEIKKISKKPKSTDYLVDLLIQFEDKTNEKNNST
ncbi:hypothetical protein KKE45_01035, partial [Patescibacteria group bacterium]|nr:hypothetical protein [Patescibacteria group bacterium]